MSNEPVVHSSDLRLALSKAMNALKANQSKLQKLDAAVGDGDLGFTVSAGASSVLVRLESLEAGNPQTILVEAGKAFNKAASSTFGTLFSAALMAAGKAAGEAMDLSLSDLCSMLGAAINTVQQRGRAKLGDKTFLDILIPVHEAFAALLKGGKTSAEIASHLQAVANDALKQSASLEAKAGRASYIGERSKGVPDPGGKAICVVLASFASTGNSS